MRQPNNSCRCSFCGKLATEVVKLIAGPGIYICDECVMVCGEILAKEIPGWPEYLRCPKDPLRMTHDMLASMRAAGEISEPVFTARLAEAMVREFSPSGKTPPEKKGCRGRDKGRKGMR